MPLLHPASTPPVIIKDLRGPGLEDKYIRSSEMQHILLAVIRNLISVHPFHADDAG